MVCTTDGVNGQCIFLLTEFSWNVNRIYPLRLIHKVRLRLRKNSFSCEHSHWYTCNWDKIIVTIAPHRHPFTSCRNFGNFCLILLALQWWSKKIYFEAYTNDQYIWHKFCTVAVVVASWNRVNGPLKYFCVPSKNRLRIPSFYNFLN